MKKFTIITLISLLITLIFPIAIKAEEDIIIEQTEHNTTKLTMIVNDNVDEVQIDAYMLYNNEKCQTYTFKDKVVDNKINFDIGYFGKWYATISLYNNGSLINEIKQEIIVTSTIYNIAYIDASLPILIFTLKLMDGSISYSEDGELIPTIMSFVRASQIDWNELPENSTNNPYVDNELERDHFYKYPAMTQYMRDLYALNPESKFVLYYTDCYMYYEVPEVIWYENPIPEDQYKLILLTDGGLSYFYFQWAYDNVKDAQSRHNEMLDYLKKVKQDAENGIEIPKEGDPVFNSSLALYVYALMDYLDGEWWLIRKASDTLAIKDENFLQKVLDDERVTSNYINGLLQIVQDDGKGEEYKKLFKFEDSDFDNVNDEEIMMILGAGKRVEDSDPIEPYVDIIKQLYGDQYVYFYKGHPGYLPELNEGRLEELQAMDLVVLDSSIAAELFIFYHPEINLCGYTSSTFQNAGTVETDRALFGVNKKNAYENPDSTTYAANMEYFISHINPKQVHYDIRFRLNGEDDFYLIENNENNRYAIYNANTKEMKYYRRIYLRQIFYIVCTVAVLLLAYYLYKKIKKKEK